MTFLGADYLCGEGGYVAEILTYLFGVFFFFYPFFYNNKNAYMRKL